MGRCFIRTGIVTLVLASPALARQQVLDEGILIIHQGQNAIAREEFRVLATSTGLQIRSTTYYPPRRTRVVIETSVDLGADSLPAIARLDTNGGESITRARFGTRRMTFRLQSPSGESAREYPAASRTQVVSDSVFALYAVPAGLRPGVVRLTWPREDRRTDFVLSVAREQPTSHQGTPMSLTRVTFTAGQDIRHVWFDSRGRLIRVEVPLAGMVAERQ